MKLENILLVSLDNDLTDKEWITFRSNLNLEIKKEKLKGVIFDLSKIMILDSYASNTVNKVIQTLKFLGLKVIVVGIQPEVAFSMIQLGIRLNDTITASNLDDGLSKMNQ